MHLIERYSLGCGVRIAEPFIYEKFFPFLLDKYITIHTTSKEAKNYDYWQDVVDILIPVLNKEGISILQIGAKEDKPVNFIYSAVGQTNINQTAYLVKHSLLHLGIDSFPVHIAGSYDKPIVALYSTNHLNCVRPYWGDREKQILIEPDREKLKPSFAMVEHPKTINTIPPERIARAVCQLLRIKLDYPYESIYVGEAYESMLVETSPNTLIDTKQYHVDNIVIRMDFEFNEQALANQLNTSKGSIVTNKPINPNLLGTFKPNIIEMHYEITKDHNPDFVKFVQHLGINLNLFSFLPEEEINKLKIQYMDFGLIHPQPLGPPKELESYDVKSLSYKSSKFTLSNGKVYPSHHAMLNDVTIDGIGNHLISLENTSDKHIEFLWRDRRHLRFVKKKT